jgi:hypothetical protein
MHSHGLKCSRISPDAKAKAEAYWPSKNAAGTTNTPPGSATASGGGRSTGPSPTFAPPRPAKRRKTGNCIAEYGAFRDRFKHNKEEHCRLVAELVSVCKVPFNVVSSPQFRRLQDFYVASAERTVKSGLVVHPAKIRNEMLPLRYSEAIDRSRVRIDASPLCEQFTLADDGWSLRRKVHYTTITIGAPRVPPETVALCRTLPSELHGITIAKGWEHLILLGGRGAPLDDYPAGFAVPLPEP